MLKKIRKWWFKRWGNWVLDLEIVTKYGEKRFNAGHSYGYGIGRHDGYSEAHMERAWSFYQERFKAAMAQLAFSAADHTLSEVRAFERHKEEAIKLDAKRRKTMKQDENWETGALQFRWRLEPLEINVAIDPYEIEKLNR